MRQMDDERASIASFNNQKHLLSAIWWIGPIFKSFLQLFKRLHFLMQLFAPIPYL